MPQVSLVNRSGKVIKAGDYVKLHDKFKDAFVYADYWDRELIGNATQETYPGKRCIINLLNTFDSTTLDAAIDIVSNAVSVLGDEVDVLENAISVVSAHVASIHAAMQDPTGFESRIDSSVTLSAAVLHVTTASAYGIWFDGVKHVISATKSISISDVEGAHLIYFDTDDTIKEYVNPTTANILEAIRDKCLIAYVYWDATNKVPVYFGEERHGTVMDGITHYYLHNTHGLQYVSGLGLEGFTIGDGSLDTHAQFGVEEGAVADEDIGLTVSQIASNIGLPILYMEGANNYWRTVTQAGFACYQNPAGVTNRLMYNQYVGAAWQLTEVGEGDYVLYHIFATTGKVKQMYSIMGQAEYTTLPSAREGAATEINSLITTNLPSAEIRPIATVIFQTDKDYGNTINARIIEVTTGGDDYIDWRANELARGTTVFDATPLSNAISALEVRVSTLSTAYSALEVRVSALSAAPGGGGSVTSNEFSALEARVSSLSAVPAGSVTSNEFSVLADIVSNEISNRVSASAVLDAKISALSAMVVSGLTSADALRSTLSALVVSGLASADALRSTLSAAHTSTEGRVTSLETRISTVSANYLSVDQRVSVLSASHTSTEGRVTSLETRISTVSANYLSVDQRVSVLSAAHTSTEGRATSLEARISAVSALVGGGGSVTSNEFSALERRVSLISATVATSAGIDVRISTLSAAMTYAGQVSVDRFSMAFMSVAATISASAITGVSGTTIQVSSGSFYVLEGMFAVTHAAGLVALKLGLTIPACNMLRGEMRCTGSVGQGALTISIQSHQQPILPGMAGGNSTILSIVSTTQTNKFVAINAILNPSATGNIFFMVGAAAGASAAIVSAGGFLRTEKLR